MNLLLLDPAELDPSGRARLDGRRAEHLRRVLGVEAGQSLRAGLVDGPVGSAEVLLVETHSVTVLFRPANCEEAGSDDEDRRGEEPDVDLIVGLPRPQVLRRVLQTTAAMCVRRLDLVNAWQVEKSFFQTPSLADDKVRRQLLLGAEQGMTTRLPRVHQQPLLVPFVRSLGAAAERPLRLIAHPDADIDLEQAVLAGAPLKDGADPCRTVQIAIGPEGGWIDREVQTFGEIGFRTVRLGRWILRVEVAVAVALGQLAMARRIGQRLA